MFGFPKILLKRVALRQLKKEYLGLQEAQLQIEQFQKKCDQYREYLEDLDSRDLDSQAKEKLEKKREEFNYLSEEVDLFTKSVENKTGLFINRIRQIKRLYDSRTLVSFRDVLSEVRRDGYRSQTGSYSKTAEKLLYFFLSKEQRESLPGDLEEEYNTVIVPKFGVSYARKWYWQQVLSSIWPVFLSRAKNLAVFAWMGKVAEWVYAKFGI